MNALGFLKVILVKRGVFCKHRLLIRQEEIWVFEIVKSK